MFRCDHTVGQAMHGRAVRTKVPVHSNVRTSKASLCSSAPLRTMAATNLQERDRSYFEDLLFYLMIAEIFTVGVEIG